LAVLSVLILGTAALVAKASDSGASVTVDYVGTQCVERSDTTSGYYYGISIQNDSTTGTIAVYCPVENDNTIALWDTQTTVSHHTDSHHDWSAVVDANSSGNVSCYLAVCNRDYTSCDTGTTMSTSTSGVHTLSNSTNTVGSNDNIVFMKCDLPKKAGSNRAELRSYQIVSY
jgi:hypothetical protein